MSAISLLLLQQAHAGAYNCGTQGLGRFEFSSATELKRMINSFQNSEGYILKDTYGINDKSFEITKVTDVVGHMIRFPWSPDAQCVLTLEVNIINRQPDRWIEERRVRHGKARFYGVFGNEGLCKDCWKPYTFEITELDATTSARENRMSSEITDSLRELSDKLCLGHLELNSILN